MQLRSTFVSVVAWLFIILSGFSSLIALAQNLMLHLAFPLDKMKEQAASQYAQNIPAFARFMVGHFDWFFAAFLLVSLITLIISIGLLKRRNWARLAFISLMIAGILWNIAGIIIQQSIMADMPLPANAPAEYRAQAETMHTIITALSVVFAGGAIVLFAWITWKLRSPAIAAEFRPEHPAAQEV